jgi:hypothetical protein
MLRVVMIDEKRPARISLSYRNSPSVLPSFHNRVKLEAHYMRDDARASL